MNMLRPGMNFLPNFKKKKKKKNQKNLNKNFLKI